MKFAKTLFAVAAATALLGTLASAASARNLATTSQTVRVAFRSITFRGAFGDIVCPVTVEGSFHSRTHAKVVGSLVGYITRADLGACPTGRATVLREALPWHVRYQAFSGSLPNISSITAHATGMAFSIREPFATCLARSDAANPGIIHLYRESAGAATTTEFGGTIPTTCGASGTFMSTRDTPTVLNTTTRITITLI